MTQHTILLAEDQPSIRQMMTDVFTSNGFSVTSVTNGLSALEEAKRGEYSLILLDLKMPEMDGLEVLRHLNQHSHKNKAVVIFSSVTYPYAKEEAFRLGVDAFIHKDQFEPLEILSMIKEIISKKSQPQK